MLECVTSEQAVIKVERNLRLKLPAKIPEFRLIVSRSLQVLPDPKLSDLAFWHEQADQRICRFWLQQFRQVVSDYLPLICVTTCLLKGR